MIDRSAPVLAFVVMGVVVFLPFMALDAYSCSSRWAKSGFETSWGPLQGCNIRPPGGRWMPEKNYRETP